MKSSPWRLTVVLISILLGIPDLSGFQQQNIQPKPAIPIEPITVILDAFRSYSVVALSEGTQGNEQGQTFQLNLIRDPRFIERVNDIVLEGPNALYQDVMDRYVMATTREL